MPEDKGDSYIAVCILITIFMNAFLAVINNNVVSINQNVVIFVQLIITVFSMYVVLRTANGNTVMYLNKMVVLFLLVLFSLAVRGGGGYMELYGLFVIPLYVLLGVNFKGDDYKFIKFMLCFICFFALLEIFFVEIYIEIFNPLSYYTSTREWASKVLDNQGISSFDVADGDLYFGAYRPGGTISGLSHRVGSIFLEPLTLGFFGFFVFLFLYHLNSYKLKGIVLYSLACVFLAVVSDTRIAVFMIFLTIFLRYSSKFIPNMLVPLMPFLILFSVFSVYMFASGILSSEMALRIGTTFDPFLNSNFLQIISGDLNFPEDITLGDSGLIKIISASGVLGTIYYYYLITGVASGFKLDKIYTLSFTFFFVVITLFSVLVLSVKAAAAYAFFSGLVYGRINNRESNL